MNKDISDPKVERERALARTLDAAGWGCLLAWIGIAFLASVGWGIGVLGVGIIALGGQLARKYFGLRVEVFPVVFGIIFLLGGITELMTLKVGSFALADRFVPILLIVAGALLFIFALKRRPERAAR